MTSPIQLPPPLSSSPPDSDTASPTTSSSLLRTDLSSTIFRSYIEISNSSHFFPDLAKIQSFLTSSRSGALSCLICLDRIHPTWSCTSGCSAVFHLLCIQSWARQSSDLAASRAASRLPISASKANEISLWNSPKCRLDYPKTLIPKTYLCFCS